MSQATLVLTDTDTALSLLPADLVALFNDNGGEPDGPAWLPSSPITSAEAAAVLKAKAGRMVKAIWLTDTEAADRYHIHDALELAERDDDWPAFQNAVTDHARLWSHYGSYGAADARWVLVE